MKKTISLINLLVIALVAMLGNFNLNLSAQTIVTADGQQVALAVDDMAPLVPIEVGVRGRQATVSYLFQRIDHVVVKVVGRSIMSPDGWGTYTISRQELRDRGYMDNGSFSQLQKAINGYRFNAKILPYDDNGKSYFDVRLDIGIYSSDGKKSFVGNGYVPVSVAKGGGVVLGDTQSWVYLNPSITLSVDEPINGAKWIGNNYGEVSSLSVWYVSAGKAKIAYSADNLNRGHLAVALDMGNIVVIDMSSGYRVSAEDADGVISKLGSSEIQVLLNPSDEVNWGDGDSFYRSSDGQVQGSFPLKELVTDRGIKGAISISVKIWGTETRITPDRVFATPVKLFAPTPEYSVGVEKMIPQMESGNWAVSLPAGIYHIRTDFYNVKPFSGGKG